MAPGGYSLYVKVLTYNGVHYNGFQYDMDNTGTYNLEEGDTFEPDPDEPAPGLPNGTCIGHGFYLCTADQVPYWTDLYSNIFYVSRILENGFTLADPSDETLTKTKVVSFTLSPEGNKIPIIDFLPTLLSDSNSGEEWMTNVLTKNQAALKFISSSTLKLPTGTDEIPVAIRVFWDFPESWQNVRYLSLFTGSINVAAQSSAYGSAFLGYLSENSTPTQSEFKNNFYDLLIPYNNSRYPYKPYVEADGGNLYDIYLARESPAFESSTEIHSRGLVIPQRPVTAPPRPTFTQIMNSTAASNGIDDNTVIASFADIATGNTVIISYSRTATNKFYYILYAGATNIFTPAAVPNITGDAISLTSVSGLQFCGNNSGILCFILIGQQSPGSCEIYRLDFNPGNGNLVVTRLTLAAADDDSSPLVSINGITKFLCYNVDPLTVRIIGNGVVSGTGKFLDMTISIVPPPPGDQSPNMILINITYINFPSNSIGALQHLKRDEAVGEASTVVALFTLSGYTYNLSTKTFVSIAFTSSQAFKTVSFDVRTVKWVFATGADSIITSSDLVNVTTINQNYINYANVSILESFSSENYTYLIGSDSSSSPAKKLTLYRVDPVGNIVYPVVYNNGQAPLICQASGKKSAFASYYSGLIVRNTEGATDSLYALYDTSLNALPGVDFGGGGVIPG